jgi:hypothetical protein
MLQLLTLKLDGITAGDYLTWCRDPDPPALNFALRSVHVDAEPLSDTIIATLDWNQPAPSPAAAATAAGLPLLPGAQIHPLTTWAAATLERLSGQEGVGVIDLERRPATRLGDHQTFARKHPGKAARDLRSRRRRGPRSEGPSAEDRGPATGQPSESALERPERTQVRHELDLALTDLGGATFALAYHGALTDERLAPRVQRVHDLFAQLSALDNCTHNSQQNIQLVPARAA